MNRPTRLRLGLWIRMAVATVIACFGIAILLPLEVFAVGAMVIVFLTVVPPMIIAFLLFYGVWIVIAGIYRRIMPAPLVVGRIAHDGTADAIESVAHRLTRPATGFSRRQLAGTVAGLGVWYAGLLFVVHGGTPTLLATVLVITVLVGTTVAVYHTGRTIYDELGTGGTVEQHLERDVDIADPIDGSSTDDAEAVLNSLQTRVDRLATQSDVPAPTVRLGRKRLPLAATAGLRPATSTIVVSPGLYDSLSDRELEAVLAHELAHVVNRDAAVLTALSLPAAKVDSVLEAYDQEEDTIQEAIHHPAMVLAEMVVAGICRWSAVVVARYREYAADDGAVALTGDPAALASALEKLDADLERHPSTDLREHRTAAAFSIVPPPWEEHRFFDRTRRFIVRTILGTHPPTEKRIDRLRNAIDDAD